MLQLKEYSLIKFWDLWVQGSPRAPVREGRGFRVQGLGVQGLGLRAQGLGLRVQGLGFRVAGLGFRVLVSDGGFGGSAKGSRSLLLVEIVTAVSKTPYRTLLILEALIKCLTTKPWKLNPNCSQVTPSFLALASALEKTGGSAVPVLGYRSSVQQCSSHQGLEVQSKFSGLLASWARCRLDGTKALCPMYSFPRQRRSGYRLPNATCTYTHLQPYLEQP